MSMMMPSLLLSKNLKRFASNAWDVSQLIFGVIRILVLLGGQMRYRSSDQCFSGIRSSCFPKTPVSSGIHLRSIAMESEWIVCVQCDDDFEFNTADQIRYEQKGFEPPQRCPACRKHKHKVIYLDRSRVSKNRKILYHRKREMEY